MDYEKKYNEALERASKLRVQNPFDTVSQMMEHVFPELADSEDERIRKGLIEYFKDFRLGTFAYLEPKKIIAWLERQKEFVSADFDDVWETADCNELTAPLEKYSKDAIKEMCHAWYDKGIELERRNWLEKQGEQKPAKNEELTEFDKAVGVSIGTWNPKSPEQIQSVKAVSKKLLKLAKKQINDEQKSWSEEVEAAISLLKHIAEEQEKDYCPHNANDLRKAAQYLEICRPQNTCKPSDEHYELEEFAKIVRCNLTGISKSVQQLFEAKYLQLTGNKMYEGFKD